MYYSRFFVRALPIAALTFAVFGTQPVVAQQGAAFCEALKKVMSDKPNNFETFKTGEWHERTKEWDASVKLPALETCRIDIELKNYNCFTVGISAGEASRQAEALKGQISACIGSQPGEPKVDERPETTRTLFRWPGQGGAAVEVVLRVGKGDQPRNSVFVYVE